MKLRPRLDALEAKSRPEAAALHIFGTLEEAAAQVASTPAATVIITGVPRNPLSKPQ